MGHSRGQRVKDRLDIRAAQPSMGSRREAPVRMEDQSRPEASPCEPTGSHHRQPAPARFTQVKVRPQNYWSTPARVRANLLAKEVVCPARLPPSSTSTTPRPTCPGSSTA